MSSTPDLTDNSTSRSLQLMASPSFHSSDADVIFKSNDDILFHIHRKNLEVHAGGFPPAEFNTKGEVVCLTEDAATLEALFQYVYPQRYPDIELLPFEDLYKLAEAAEKYKIFSVITICKARIKYFVEDHPAEIFHYAYRHNYHDILSITAPLLLDIPVDEFVMTIPSEVVLPWIRYREHWSRTALNVIYSLGRCAGCKPNASIQSEASRIIFDLGSKRTFKAMSELMKNLAKYKKCLNCQKAIPAESGLDILRRALDAVPKFDTFLICS